MFPSSREVNGNPGDLIHCTLDHKHLDEVT